MVLEDGQFHYQTSLHGSNLYVARLITETCEGEGTAPPFSQSHFHHTTVLIPDGGLSAVELGVFLSRSI